MQPESFLLGLLGLPLILFVFICNGSVYESYGYGYDNVSRKNQSKIFKKKMESSVLSVEMAVKKITRERATETNVKSMNPGLSPVNE